jgi:glycosyltransferase involved in cell wall biosynthesis
LRELVWKARSLGVGERNDVTFSVMLPTHEPDHRLAEAVRSVLAQDPGAAAMEIVVVDDGTRNADVAAIVRAADPAGRVRIDRHTDRLGLAGNWNRAVETASGRLVHLLHQDDLVQPGFYGRIARGFERAPRIGMAFCRNTIIDAAGRCLKTASRLRWLPGVLAGWPETIGVRQRVQTPAAVVARTAYEAVGGYRADLPQTLDWEMWVRIAARFPVWYEPRTLAAYRRHAANETTRLAAAGAYWPDVVRAIRINAGRFPERSRPALVRRSVEWHLRSLARTAERDLRAGRTAAARATLGAVPDMLSLLADRAETASIDRRFANLRRLIESRSAAA